MYKRIDEPTDESFEGWSFVDDDYDEVFVSVPYLDDESYSKHVSIGAVDEDYGIEIYWHDIPKLIKALEAAYNHKEA